MDAAVRAAGRLARGRRSVALVIAATALANDLPLYTRNPGDFDRVDGLLDVVYTENSPVDTPISRKTDSVGRTEPCANRLV